MVILTLSIISRKGNIMKTNCDRCDTEVNDPHVDGDEAISVSMYFELGDYNEVDNYTREEAQDILKSLEIVCHDCCQDLNVFQHFGYEFFAN